jgi:hypothetical protein
MDKLIAYRNSLLYQQPIIKIDEPITKFVSILL